jgi:hypothetical protein
VANKLTAQTTKTGTVTLAFLPPGETLIRIRKVGYAPRTLVVAVSPRDTIPYTVLLESAAQELPTVVTTDSARRWLSPGLRDFESRRTSGARTGQFLDDSILRRYDAGSITNALRRLSALRIDCHGSICSGISTRLPSASSRCRMKLYVNGVQVTDANLENYPANQFSGVEYYSGPSQTPIQYGGTNASCGVLLLWSRERM